MKRFEAWRPSLKPGKEGLVVNRPAVVVVSVADGNFLG